MCVWGGGGGGSVHVCACVYVWLCVCVCLLLLSNEVYKATSVMHTIWHEDETHE